MRIFEVYSKGKYINRHEDHEDIETEESVKAILLYVGGYPEDIEVRQVV